MDDAPLHLDTVMSLAAAGAQRRYPKRTLLFQEGDLSDDLYVLLSGRVEVYLADADGRRIVVDILEPVTYFGEMALDGRRRSASVVTLEDSRLSIIRRDQFRHFLVEHPDAAFELVVTLIQRRATSPASSGISRCSMPAAGSSTTLSTTRAATVTDGSSTSGSRSGISPNATA